MSKQMWDYGITSNNGRFNPIQHRVVFERRSALVFLVCSTLLALVGRRQHFFGKLNQQQSLLARKRTLIGYSAQRMSAEEKKTKNRTDESKPMME